MLGGLMLDASGFDAVAEVVGRSDFYKAAHRQIFGVMTQLLESDQPIDVITVAEALTERFSYEVPLLGQIPYDEALLLGGERGTPIVDSAPEHPAAAALALLAEKIAARRKSLVGQRLPLNT